MFNWLKLPRLDERAEAAAKQMRYFRLFSQRGSLDQLGASALRAGFQIVHENTLETAFQWANDTDRPDFMFHVSFDDLEEMSVTAKSCRGDIFGLVMTSLPSQPKISIEKIGSLEEHELGRKAQQLRKIMLAFPDFDDGIEDFLRRAGLDQPFAAAVLQQRSDAGV
jgi:hypothetical protein